MFQMVFPSIIRSSKLHIQCQTFVSPIVLPAVSLARLAAGSSIGLTNAWLCICSFELLMIRKNRLKHVERLTEINKLWNFASCWLYTANILLRNSKLRANRYKDSHTLLKNLRLISTYNFQVSWPISVTSDIFDHIWYIRPHHVAELMWVLQNSVQWMLHSAEGRK